TTGRVKVSASELTGANAKATGLSVSVDGTHIAAAVGLNVENVTNDATVGQDAVVTGNGITVEAGVPDGKEKDFIVWGLSAAGGESKASVSGSVGVQVLSYHTEASIAKGAHLISGDDIGINATNKMGLENLALAAAGSGGSSAVGGAFCVNVFP